MAKPFERQRKGDEDPLQPLADALTEPLSAVEAEIYQVKNRSGQDPLNFPVRLNDKLANLMGLNADGDFPPTKQAEEVRQGLTKMIDDELTKLDALIDSNVNLINQKVKEKGIEMVMIKKEPTKL